MNPKEEKKYLVLLVVVALGIGLYYSGSTAQLTLSTENNPIIGPGLEHISTEFPSEPPIVFGDQGIRGVIVQESISDIHGQSLPRECENYAVSFMAVTVTEVVKDAQLYADGQPLSNIIQGNEWDVKSFDPPVIIHDSITFNAEGGLSGTSNIFIALWGEVIDTCEPDPVPSPTPDPPSPQPPVPTIWDDIYTAIVNFFNSIIQFLTGGIVVRE